MAGPTQPPPTLNNPAGGPAQLLSSLWTTYGPTIMAGGAQLLRQTAAATNSGAAARQTSANALNTPPESTYTGRNFEAAFSSFQAPQPIPPANNPARPSMSSTASSSSGASSSGLRERAISGNFQEIKGGDIEGYEVDDDFIGGFVSQSKERPIASKRNSWFGGWVQGSSRKDGHEHLKND